MSTSRIIARMFFLVMALFMALSATQAQPILNVQVSDQKAGSLLVFPYYTSKAQDRRDTRVTISNPGPKHVTVHIFMLDGSNCSQADQFTCLTPNASVAFRASELDPEVTGWILAVAVDDLTGHPITANSLIGNAFLQDGDYVGNYGAETFWAQGTPSTILDPNAGAFGTATLKFNGGAGTGGYDMMPTQFAVEIQSINDSVGQRIVTVGMVGDLTAGSPLGAGQVGIGQLYNGNEKPFGSFTRILNEGCQASVVLNAAVPRVPLGMGNLIPPGHIGTMKFFIGGGVGLFMTPKTLGNRWFGVRNLHKISVMEKTLVIPIFTPSC
ncbi:MAG TPA: hypothetical protein VFZ34_06655 [Blastocatellia bacterium]|nr:hypothetical protein [Blastocatellia bacterium]